MPQISYCSQSSIGKRNTSNNTNLSLELKKMSMLMKLFSHGVTDFVSSGLKIRSHSFYADESLELHLSCWRIKLEVVKRISGFLPRLRTHALPEELKGARYCLKWIPFKASLDHIFCTVVASMSLRFRMISSRHSPWALSSRHWSRTHLSLS